MKFFLKIIVTTFLVLVGVPCFSQGPVPNGNLEVWVGNKPQGWNTSNDLTNIPFVGFQSVFRSTDSFQGQFAARLVTGTLLGNIIPGYITLGVLNVNIQNPTQSGITGGHAFASRPLLLRGHYKYNTSGNDTGLGAVILRKYNPQTGVRDTIAAGGWIFSPQQQYVQFSMPILYLSNQTPDTLNTLFLSSNFETITTGSTLFIDSLHFVYGQVSFIDLGPDTYLCTGNTITLDAGPGFQSYTWVNIDELEPIGQGQQLLVAKPGRYGVIALDNDDLPVTGSIRIFKAPGPEVFKVEGGGPFAHPAQGSEVTLSGSQVGTRYHLLRNNSALSVWQGTGVPISFGLQPPGVYSVKAINTDHHQCEMLMDGSVTVTNATNVNQITMGAGLRIFPNPGGDEFTIDPGLEFSNGRVVVYTVEGKRVLETNVTPSVGGTFSLLLPKETARGLHLLMLQLPDGNVLSGKFMVSQ